MGNEDGKAVGVKIRRDLTEHTLQAPSQCRHSVIDDIRRQTPGSESIREGSFHNYIHIGNFGHCQSPHMSNVDDFAYDRICKANQGGIEFRPASNKNSLYFLIRKKLEQFGSGH